MPKSHRFPTPMMCRKPQSDRTLIARQHANGARRAMKYVVLCVLATSVVASAAEPLAWWRFEGISPGQWLTARRGSSRWPYSTIADASDRRHQLRTYNTDPWLYPPNTSPEFVTDVPTAVLAGGIPNKRSAHFTGKQFLYSVDATVDAPLYADGKAHPFTAEGMFKLEEMPYDYDGRPQTILCKEAAPKIDLIELAIENAPPLANRPAGPTTRPTTNRSATAPATTHTTRPATTQTTRPATTQSTQPATTQSTRPAYNGPTERINDHPVQPIVCFVAGTNAWPEPADVPVDHFAVVLVDAHGHKHVLRSRQPLRAQHWYAFAVEFNGYRAKLLLSDLSSTSYQLQTPSISLPGGLWPCRGRWMVGCGLIDDVRQDWFQGWIDEVRLSLGVQSPTRLLAYGAKTALAPVTASHGYGGFPASIVHGLADPDVMLDHGIYYLYGTRDQAGFPVYSSTDLLHWKRGPEVFRCRRGMWGESRYWAPSVIAWHGRYYLFYSCLGPLSRSGGRMSHRVCIAVSDRPTGPFRPYIAPLPLIGKAVIDPDVFVDPATGHAYLYFVADMSENEISQIFVARLNDTLTATIGEPVLCIQPSQIWEGRFWNEGPDVFERNGIYVMTYSAQFWHSPDYGVGFATSRTPTGPWTKNPGNPIMQHWRHLFGSGGDCIVPMPKGQDMAIFYHADGPPGTRRRDTYVDRLRVTSDPHLGLMLKCVPWSPALRDARRSDTDRP